MPEYFKKRVPAPVTKEQGCPLGSNGIGCNCLNKEYLRRENIPTPGLFIQNANITATSVQTGPLFVVQKGPVPFRTGPCYGYTSEKL